MNCVPKHPGIMLLQDVYHTRGRPWGAEFINNIQTLNFIYKYRINYRFTTVLS